MGDIVKQDRAYTIEVVLAVINKFEGEFQAAGYKISLAKMEAAMFFIATCFGGFRGFETVWTDLGALRFDVNYCEETDNLRAFSWPVTGRFKNEKEVWGH